MTAVPEAEPPGGRKSRLHRAGCWVTPRRGDPTESATETYRRFHPGSLYPDYAFTGIINWIKTGFGEVKTVRVKW